MELTNIRLLRKVHCVGKVFNHAWLSATVSYCLHNGWSYVNITDYGLQPYGSSQVGELINEVKKRGADGSCY